jgi:putative tricarboxylic transport membrane protein
MLASVLLLLFGGMTLLLSLQLPLGTLHMPGSGFFPFLLGLLLMGLAACQTFLLWRRAGAGTAESAAEGQADGSARQVLIFMGIIVLATALLELLGFPLVAFLLMLALLKLLGVRRWRDSALIALLTAGASYMLFVRWLQIPMPKGWLGL